MVKMPKDTLFIYTKRSGGDEPICIKITQDLRRKYIHSRVTLGKQKNIPLKNNSSFLFLYGFPSTFFFAPFDLRILLYALYRFCDYTMAAVVVPLTTTCPTICITHTAQSIVVAVIHSQEAIACVQHYQRDRRVRCYHLVTCSVQYSLA